MITESDIKNNLNAKNIGLKGLLTPFLIIVSGIFAFIISSWNSQQAVTLMEWAADREGKAVFTRIVHESGASPGMFFRNPTLLEEQVASDSSIVTAGIMLGETIIASFTQTGFEKEFSRLTNPEIGSKIISPELTIFRKFSGPGSGGGGGWRGNGQGPPWMRGTSNPDNQDANDGRISFYFVFKGPDRSIIAPLRYQSYLWPLVWLILSLLWAGIIMVQTNIARLQQQIQKDSHLTSVGKMSARLAHEIKNPLGAVRGIAQILNKKLEEKPELKALTQTIEKETFRLEELTRSILDFAKPIDCRPIKLNLVPIVAETVKLIQNQNSENPILLELPKSDVFCHCDENATRQIIFNLLKNAIDASEKNQPVNVLLDQEINQVKLKIYNYGQLTPEAQENKFEPFFSTKIKGYGLGLPISKKLAEQQHGDLTLENFDKNTILAELTLIKES